MKKENLSVLAYANGFTLWHYRTTAASEYIEAYGYFSKAGNMLRVGDIILVQASDKIFQVACVEVINQNEVVMATMASTPQTTERG